MIKTLSGLVLISLLTGCASRGPKIVAVRYAGYSPSFTNRIALAEHQESRPGDALLRTALASELTRRGSKLSTTAEADYVLAYWIEDSWNTIHSAGGVSFGGSARPVGNVTYQGSPLTTKGSMTVGMASDGTMERYLAAQGIRLELYPREKLRTGDLSPAWFGYIEAGISVKPGQEANLLSALLDYFGQDFSGRPRLAR